MAKPPQRSYYHVTFSPHRRFPALWGEIEEEFYLGASDAAHRWTFAIHAMAAVPDHVHILIEKAPWDDLSDIVNMLKGVTSRRIGRRFPELKLDMKSDHFWQAGYHYERHGDNTLQTVITYIENQKRKAGLEE